jgi:Intracellular proteinase inhibitor
MDGRSSCTLVLCQAILLAACSNGGSDGGVSTDPPAPPARAPEQCGAFASTLTIKDRMQQPVNVFNPGEPVTLEMRITNASANPAALGSGTECTQGFFVADRSNNMVWHSGDGVACTMQFIQIQLAPGETFIYSRQWNLTGHDGTRLPAGVYTVHTADSTECSEALHKSALLNIR